MPRDIPLGNGRLLVCFDRDYSIRDLYFPHVGQENHLGEGHCRLGVWVSGRFAWLTDGWRHEVRYEADTLVSRVRLRHEALGLELLCRDAVDFHEDLFLREVTVQNLLNEPREVRLFFCQDFRIYGTNVGNTAAFDPKTGGVVHYKGERYFLMNGCAEGASKLDQFAVGHSGIGWEEGTFRDAEDGLLSRNAISQGSVDSVVAVHLVLQAASSGKAFYWIGVAENWEEARRLDSLAKYKGVGTLIKRTADYWRLWARKETPPLELLPAKVALLYRRSLLVLCTQIDWQGGITAANDSDVVAFNRDTYSYVWPRDGSLVANALDMAGYSTPARNFYNFMAQRIEKEGFFLHKYNPDGTLASSWHPWVRNGVPVLPIQEDETALVVWALWNHFVTYRDLEFIKPFYKPVIKNAADFLTNFRDRGTGLPGESYDLWEERFGISSFAVGAVFGGLTAASLFCKVFGEDDLAALYQRAAAEVRDAASRYLWSPELKRFHRMVSRDAAGGLQADSTCDASLWGLSAFGLYAASDPRIQSTMAAMKEKLWAKTPVGGMARYENDPYYRVSGEVTGTPWFVCSLWYADYLAERAGNEEEVQEAVNILMWVADHALPSGVLAEQVHPMTGEPISVAPLTWSHGTFVASTQRILRRLGNLRGCPECGLTRGSDARREHWMERLFADTCSSIHGMCSVD